MWCVIGGDDGDQLGELNQINGFSNASEKCAFDAEQMVQLQIEQKYGKAVFFAWKIQMIWHSNEIEECVQAIKYRNEVYNPISKWTNVMKTIHLEMIV